MDYDSFAPFVIAKFEGGGLGGGLEFTVGNESYSQRPNTAVIKSMEFGYMDKPSARLEVVDEVGGDLGLFVDALRKCGNQKVASTMQLKFGWVKSNCESFGEQDMVTFDGFIKMMLVEVQVSYGEGLVKYVMEGTALDVVTTNMREDVADGPGMRLVDAISRICATKGITPVFASVQADGSIKAVESWPQGLSADKAPWEWNVGGTDGPRGSWQGDNNDVLSTISRWIEPYRIKHGRWGAGILMAFDSKEHNRLFLWKDPKSDKKCPDYSVSAAQTSSTEGKVKGQRSSLGTFIVNGGKCSPVIRFDPKINFISGLAQKNTGGTAGGAESSEPVKSEGDSTAPTGACAEDDKGVGPEHQATITQSAKENYAPDLVNREATISSQAHVRANGFAEFTINPLQAEMTTIGMPTDDFVNFLNFLFSPVSIIVINPFFLSGARNEGCGDWSWLAGSGCNQILSDNQWICEGVNHSIKEGSYTTTLKLMNVNKMKLEVSLDKDK
jgi:hypothetical protein